MLRTWLKRRARSGLVTPVSLFVDLRMASSLKRGTGGPAGSFPGHGRWALRLGGARAQRRLHALAQAVDLERLEEQGEDAQRVDVAEHAIVPVGGDDDDRRRLLAPTDAARQFDAVHARQPH